MQRRGITDEFKKLRMALNFKYTSEGDYNKIDIRNAICSENDKEIKAMLDGKKKVKDI